jgi:hypothetical protein
MGVDIGSLLWVWALLVLLSMVPTYCCYCWLVVVVVVTLSFTMTVMLLNVMLFVGVDGPGVDVNFGLMCGVFVGVGVACVGCVIVGAIFGVGVEVGDLPPTPSVTAPVSVAFVFVTTRLWICYCLWRRG